VHTQTYYIRTLLFTIHVLSSSVVGRKWEERGAEEVSSYTTRLDEVSSFELV